MRATLIDSQLPGWRIDGPLNDQRFYLPIVAETGHPSLSVRWATALELIHLSLDEAFSVLLKRFERWFTCEEWDDDEIVRRDVAWKYSEDVNEFWLDISRSPAMYCGSNGGWSLYCFLMGMRNGGNWLGLPPCARLEEIIGGIERKSKLSYGSVHGAFRVYEQDPKNLIEMGCSLGQP